MFFTEPQKRMQHIPHHLAIIMDGNGRWAKERNLPRIEGHRRGIENVRTITTAAQKRGVKILTLFAFSTENWSRPKSEVHMLLQELDVYLTRELNTFLKNNIWCHMLGRKEPFPEQLWAKMKNTEEKTKPNSTFTLNLALNYGGRAEIVDACRKYAKDIFEGKRTIEELDEQIFCQYLYAPEIPDPDLLIRTSGEQRISNFLLWELAYSEFYFVSKYWPDFSERDLDDAFLAFASRQRRFGGIQET